jgi:alpha-L-fucosidase 2
LRIPKIGTLTSFFWVAAVIASAGCRPAPRESSAVERSRRIVSPYKAVFSKPPENVPSFHEVDGPLAGNGDLGLTVSGPPRRQRYWISKNDFWKSGPDIKQTGPSLIGGLDIAIDELAGASYHVEQILYEPVLVSQFSAPGATVTIQARVLASDNMIALDIRSAGRPVRVKLDLWAKDGYGSETGKGTDNDVRWVTRSFRGKDLLFPAEAALALRQLGGTGDAFTVEPGRPAVLLVGAATNFEAAEPAAAAQAKVIRHDPDSVRRLIAGHDAWWRDFWAKSYVEIEDKLLEKYYYASHYVLACCSRNPGFPPGLYGNWTTMDRLAWSGDIHLNYNHEAPFWALYSSNRVELTDAYDAPLLEHLEIFKEYARKYLGRKGAYAPVAIGPKGLTIFFQDKAALDENYGKLGSRHYEGLAGQPMFLGQKSNALFAAMNMILRYRYTYDAAYLRKVYPFLAAVADFWESDLTFENGRYVDRDDSFSEVGPWEGAGWEKGYGDINPILTLGFLRTFFGALPEMSADAGRDAGRRAAWENILARLSPLPTVEEKGRRRFRACEGGTGSSRNSTGLDWIMMHALVFPGTLFGLGSDPADLDMIRADMRDWDDSVWLHHGNAFQTVFIGGARVGLDPDFLMAKARAKIIADGQPNLMIFAGGGGIETCSGIPGLINEMMLQSHGGVIRVFPAYPKGQRASFCRLRTFGAFLVSSAIESGRIPYVIVESERGKDLAIRNPWTGRTVIVYRGGAAAERKAGDVLNLKTAPGEKVGLAPEGTDYRKATEGILP